MRTLIARMAQVGSGFGSVGVVCSVIGVLLSSLIILSGPSSG